MSMGLNIAFTWLDASELLPSLTLRVILTPQTTPLTGRQTQHELLSRFLVLQPLPFTLNSFRWLPPPDSPNSVPQDGIQVSHNLNKRLRISDFTEENILPDNEGWRRSETYLYAVVIGQSFVPPKITFSEFVLNYLRRAMNLGLVTESVNEERHTFGDFPKASTGNKPTNWRQICRRLGRSVSHESHLLVCCIPFLWRCVNSCLSRVELSLSTGLGPLAVPYCPSVQLSLYRGRAPDIYCRLVHLGPNFDINYLTHYSRNVPGRLRPIQGQSHWPDTRSATAHLMDRL